MLDGQLAMVAAAGDMFLPLLHVLCYRGATPPPPSLPLYLISL
jgi:hypothetical protein